MKSQLAGYVQYVLGRAGLQLVRTPSIPARDEILMGLDHMISIDTIRSLALSYMKSLRVVTDGQFRGYKYSRYSTKPVLYATLAALLTKHLYGYQSGDEEEEINLVQSYQVKDGLFKDPEIACLEAEIEDWWGWRHLTMLALMTLALYGAPASYPIRYLEKYRNPSSFSKYLRSRDWGKRVDFTSNELQNVGVMLQYARDYQGYTWAGTLIEILFDVLNEKQDPGTGLYGTSFNTIEDISRGVQAGYHFWLLFQYDKRHVKYADSIIDSALRTQNALGGYGLMLDSSACDDIDSVDPLVRLSKLSAYRSSDIQSSLQYALRAILHNLNGDGGWVFRRHQAFQYGYSAEMYSGINESNIFFTWFRTLGLAYCLEGLEESPPQLCYKWNWGTAPGLQFM